MVNNKDKILEYANKACKNTLMETLNIEIIEIGDDFVVSKMPVNSRVYQPDKVLHGGATASLAETTGSFATNIFINNKDFIVRGIELSCNHVKSVTNGCIYAKAKFIHKGKTTQVLSIDVRDEKDNLITYCKLTTIALLKKK